MEEQTRNIAGINSVQQALDNGARITQLYIDEKKDSTRIARIIEQAQAKNISIEKVAKITLDLMVVGSKHQGVVADIQPSAQRISLDDILKRPAPLIVLLDGLQDPHNLGACLRSAAAANADAVIIPKNRSVSINATVSKVACGGAELLPIFTETNLSRTLEKCKKAGLWSLALTGHVSETLYDIDLTQGIVVMMGNEGSGLSHNLLKHADYQALIPMPGNIESLNVSVATGIVLFEALRQRGIA